MNEANYFIFAVQVLRRKSGVYIFWKYFKETINGILKKGKTLRERERERERQRESPKRHLSVKYIILKITYKKYVWITSLFVEKYGQTKVFKNSAL